MIAEYNHTNFSKDRSIFNYGDAYPSNWTYEFTHRLDTVQMGMNIRF